jgi:hypothetical protein
MSFTIESSLPAPTPVYGLRRKVARNGGRSGRKSAWPPRCGEEEFLDEADEHGLWEVRCERDRLAGLDEVLAYLETQATALDALEEALGTKDGGLEALHRRFREIAGETFNGVRLLGGDSEVRLLGLQCPEAFDALEGGGFTCWEAGRVKCHWRRRHPARCCGAISRVSAPKTRRSV